MVATVDFHTHILPGIDDGCASLEESIALLQMQAQQGIRHVVATPHFYAHHDHLDAFLERREAAEQLLRAEMAKYPDLPQLHVGTEVHYFAEMSQSEHLHRFAISGTRHILIEMPLCPWTEQMYRQLEQIYTHQGLTPIVAHVDRYIRPLQTHQIPQKLGKLPVLVQANAEFFLNKQTASMAMRLLGNGQIHLLGSDCHNAVDRKPNLQSACAAIEKRLGQKAAAIAQWEQAVLFGK